MRNSIFLASLLFLSVPSAHAVMFDGQGIDTGKGYMKWEQLIHLPHRVTALENQVQTLRTVFFLGSVVLAGTFIYLKWFNKPEQQKSTDEKSDFAFMQ